MTARTLLPLAILTVAIVAVVWTVRSGRLEPAEFTFSNETEIESLDPAVVTGQPEGRILWAIYEGLVRQDPKDLTPIPGVAERWEISEDGKAYTFHLRKDAKWSNGDPITAHDFVYSMRRFLDPMTAAEYAYQAWYMTNAKKYSSGPRALKPGDTVEVELHELPEGALPFARGRVLYGRLVRVEEDDVDEETLADDENYTQHRRFVVEIDGRERSFRVSADNQAADDAEVARQLLLDFREVGIHAPDDYTVVTRLNAPTAYWLQLLAFYPLSPVNRTCVETYGKPQWTYAENIVTNGAYRVKFRRLRDRIRLVKNEHYWDRDNVSIGVIDALAADSQITAFNMYETGMCDWITKVDPLIANDLLQQDPPRDDLNPQPMLTSYYYVVNVTRSPLKDPKVRLALTLAMDREEIVRTACAGERPARSLVPPGLPDYQSPLCPAPDPEGARELLAEAGFPGGAGFPKIEILYNNNETHQLIAELVRKQWQRNLGINVTIRNEEWSTYDSSLRQKAFDVARRAWGGDYLDPNTFLDMFVTGGENNDSGWSNTEYDELIEGAKHEPDEKRRLDMLYRAEQILMEELPIIPIYYYVSRNMVRPRVRGLYNNLLDQHPLWAMWIDDDATTPNQYMAPEAE